MHPHLAVAGCLLAAAAALVVVPAPAGGAAPGTRARWPGTTLERYDGSAAGRRLQGRLARARVTMRPAEWRLAQLAAVPPVLAGLLLTGAPAVTALALSASVVRLSGLLVLWRRRDRLRSARLRAAPALARLLASELTSGATPGRAIGCAAQVAAHGDAALRALLDHASLRVRAGSDGVTALEVACGVRRGSGGAVLEPDALSMVAAGFACQTRFGAAAPAALSRLGDALEDAQRTRAAAAAAMSEVRLAAFCVPVVAAVAGAVLLSVAPRAADIAASGPGLVALVGCAVTVAAGEAAVCRLTHV
ncbi:MAG: type II secretion system F family protein [Candidatus Dormibacteria bacterium]